MPEAPAADWAAFSHVRYCGWSSRGRRARETEFENPVVPGFFPDPSICRAGDDYYLVHSSFVLFPGIPIFHSRDLVNWRSCGHVMSRASQMKTLHKARICTGVYAPTIRLHEGRFYVTCTLVDGGGNYFVTATDPRGPWSEPVWLPGIDGIDPSPHFEDGRMYVIHNGMPAGEPQYQGHRAIRMQEIDPETGAALGESRVLIDGGTDLAKKPIWIEGPHILRRGGMYYLIAAEGGTAEDHSVVVFRSGALWGPYVPWAGNPILTQRDLPEDRPDPVTCTGHADLVDLPDGSWWAVFLACRPYEGNFYNMGRETFLLPVHWSDDGWPRILPPGVPVPLALPRPSIAPPSSATAVARKQVWISEFQESQLSDDWFTVRIPGSNWMQCGGGRLLLAPQAATLRSDEHASFVACRQRHENFTIETTLVEPRSWKDCEAGLVAYQDDRHHVFFAVRVAGGEFVEAFVEMTRAGAVTKLCVMSLPQGVQSLRLRAEAGGRWYAFHYAECESAEKWNAVGEKLDGSMLSTAVAGGFQGVCLGLHARQGIG